MEFCVLPRDRSAAEAALSDFSADLALVFEPLDLYDLKTLISVQQSVCAVMSSNHPLAKNSVLRFRDCLEYPLALPTKSYGVRWLFDIALGKLRQPANLALESDSFDFLRRAIGHSQLITFQIEVACHKTRFQALW